MISSIILGKIESHRNDLINNVQPGCSALGWDDGRQAGKMGDECLLGSSMVKPSFY